MNMQMLGSKNPLGHHGIMNRVFIDECPATILMPECLQLLPKYILDKVVSETRNLKWAYCTRAITSIVHCQLEEHCAVFVLAYSLIAYISLPRGDIIRL